MQLCRMGKQVVGSLRHKTSQQHGRDREEGGRDREEGGRDSVTVRLSGSVDIKKNWSEIRHLSECLPDTLSPEPMIVPVTTVLRPLVSYVLLHVSFWYVIYLYSESKPI